MKNQDSGLASAVERPTLRVEVHAEFGGDVWDCEVFVAGEHVGGGTSPHGFLDVAGDILYGDKNDWLNGYFGALHGAVAEFTSTTAEAPSGPEPTQKDSR